MILSYTPISVIILHRATSQCQPFLTFRAMLILRPYVYFFRVFSRNVVTVMKAPREKGQSLTEALKARRL